ncbi:hypothetical protein GUF51_22480, partial [Xanthomonas citri pv. citri]|nr:hypothetical protein [Xanthomonas citri pv. citri]
ALDASWALVRGFRQHIADHVFFDASPNTRGGPLSSSAATLPKRLDSNSSSDAPELFLTHIEVVYSYEDTSSMAKRGYERLPIDFNVHGGSGT